MPTRNVVITDHQAELVEQLVAKGRFQNASEVLRFGLRLVERQEAEDAARLEWLREAVALGDADIDAGRFIMIDTDEDLAAFMASLDTE